MAITDATIKSLEQAAKKLQESVEDLGESIADWENRMNSVSAPKPFVVKLDDEGKVKVFAPAGSLYLRSAMPVSSHEDNNYATYEIRFKGVDSNGWVAVGANDIHAAVVYEGGEFKGVFVSGDSVPKEALASFRVASVEENGIIQYAYGTMVITAMSAVRPVTAFELFAANKTAPTPIILPGEDSEWRLYLPQGSVVVDGEPVEYIGGEGVDYVALDGPGEYWGYVIEDETEFSKFDPSGKTIGPGDPKYSFGVCRKEELPACNISFPICTINPDGTHEQFVIGAQNFHGDRNTSFSALQVVRYLKKVSAIGESGESGEDELQMAVKVYAPEGGTVRIDGEGVRVNEADDDGWVDLGVIEDKGHKQYIWFYIDKHWIPHISVRQEDPDEDSEVADSYFSIPIASVWGGESGGESGESESGGESEELL